MNISQVKPGTIVKHYKHNPEKDSINYTYEIIGIAKHTETDELMVVYKALYFSEWLQGVEFSVRPLDMFCSNVEINGETVERFSILK